MKRYYASTLSVEPATGNLGVTWTKPVYLASDADKEIEELRLRIAVAVNCYGRLPPRHYKRIDELMYDVLTMPINELQAFLEQHPEYVPSGTEVI